MSSFVPACPICSSQSVDPWGSKNGFRLYLCVNCSHRYADTSSIQIYVNDANQFRDRFTHGLMSSDEAYFKHLCGGEKAGSHLFNTTQLILDEIATHHYSKGKRWLDIGSGSGFLVLKLQQLGWDVFGLEPGGWGQIAAKEKGIKVIQSYLDQATFKEKFSVISATDVLEHQPDPYKMLSLIRYHLESHGIVYVSVPFANSFQGRLLKSHWAMVAPPTHCQYFSNSSFHLMAERAGFKAKLVEQYNAGVPRLCRLCPISKNILDTFLKYTFGGDQALFKLSPA